MERNYYLFVKGIYQFCDENIGKRVLFPAFVDLWPETYCGFPKKDLVVLTGQIVNRLMDSKKFVLKDVSERKVFENVYGFYEILPHGQLVRKEGFEDKREKEIL